MAKVVVHGGIIFTGKLGGLSFSGLFVAGVDGVSLGWVVLGLVVAAIRVMFLSILLVVASSIRIIVQGGGGGSNIFYLGCL